jgi:L-amino acid N-acyltransferase YncA
MIDLIIRPVCPDDAKGVVNVINPIIEAGQNTVFDTPFTPQFEREYILNLAARAVFYVAEDRTNGQIVGWQSLDAFAAYTHAFDHVGVIGTYVSLDHHRQGIGTQLAQATFATARDKGYEKIFSYVRADSPQSLTFYLKLGFRIVGTAQRQAKINSTYIDEIIIEKFL